MKEKEKWVKAWRKTEERRLCKTGDQRRAMQDPGRKNSRCRPLARNLLFC